MRKLVIFNVGGALSSYLEFDNFKILIDIGNNSDFSPINNFLIPLAKLRFFPQLKHFDNYLKNPLFAGQLDKYLIDQLFISHLDKDHISDYKNFRNFFHADWMTCPNNNENPSLNDGRQQEYHFKINTDLIGEEDETRNMVIEDMKNRNPLSSVQPLGVKVPNIRLYFIKPSYCERDYYLNTNYANNISLVLFIILNEKTILLPGDLLKEGMEYLIENDFDFKNKLNTVGVDFLITPHHGLQTSFSERLFSEMKGRKTRLNIISEKIRIADSNENRSDVDGRYYSSNYSTANNDLNQYGVKTSGGHIVIDLETAETEIKQIKYTDVLIKEFLI